MYCRLLRKVQFQLICFNVVGQWTNNQADVSAKAKISSLSKFFATLGKWFASYCPSICGIICRLSLLSWQINKSLLPHSFKEFNVVFASEVAKFVIGVFKGGLIVVPVIGKWFWNATIRVAPCKELWGRGTAWSGGCRLSTLKIDYTPCYLFRDHQDTTAPVSEKCLPFVTVYQL